MNKSKHKKNSDAALAQLRQLLLQEDMQKLVQMQDELAALARKIDDKDQLIETLNPVLADLLERKIHESKSEMALALAPVMGDAIKYQVREAKEDIVDALYPVIGNMVSKAIREAMNNLMKSINQQLNQAMSNRFITVIKSKIFGIQPAELLLAEGIAFHLEELFLLDNRSGLLIGYIGDERNQDPREIHVLGSMFSAVRQFIDDAFIKGQSGELREIQQGDYTIQIDAARYTYLAAVYRGQAPHDFSEQLRQVHHRIHNRFYKQLRDHRGAEAELQDVPKLMNRLLSKYKH